MHLYMRTNDVRKRCMRACTCVCVRARTMERVSASRNRYRPAECLGEDWTRKQRLGGRIHGENDECGCVNRSHSRAGIPTPNPPLTLSLPLARLVYVNERTAAGHRRAAASLHRPRINTSAAPYFRPRNLNFCARHRVEPSYFRP
jgi:hypothetical protein